MWLLRQSFNKDEATMSINDLAAEIHDKAWVESAAKPIGRSFLLPYIVQLRDVSPVEFMVHNMVAFDAGYNIAFLQSAPEVWEHLVADDWRTVMRRLSPRPEFSHFDPTGKYSDIVFLVATLNVDAVGWMMSMDDIFQEDKLQVVRYCLANAALLFDEREDWSDFDGITFCDVGRVANYRSRLLEQQHNLWPSYTNCVTYKAYLTLLHSKLQSG